MTKIEVNEMLTVTFDSNVWENIVDPLKRDKDKIYKKIYDAICSNKIEPFFFEGLVTLECIPKAKRKEYIANYRASIEFKIENQIFTDEGTAPFELSDYLKDNLPLAFGLGFKFIRIPRIGSFSINEKYMSTLRNENIGERQNYSFTCANFIEKELGAGYQYLKNILDLSGNEHLIEKTHSNEVLTNKQFAAGVAEWVDGDALSAHYGYGIKYFCTNDKARGAGSKSVFSIENRKKLKDKFGIDIVTPTELIEFI
ncbi:hypothetical protein [Acinetobacter guillouiae]|uniref:hypothetical protein n=1 Tax=Acinetobacter guillouiae TaxID=106649 RepID=UPI00333F234A